MPKRKTLGWAAFLAAVVWIWYDYKNQIGRAIMAGWATIGLTLLHVYADK